MANFLDDVRAIGKDSRMTTRTTKKPEAAAVGGKRKQPKPPAPKMPELKNFRSNPRFREAEVAAVGLVTAKNLRDQTAKSDTGLQDLLDDEAERLVKKLLELEKGLSEDEIRELQRLSAGEGLRENRKAVRPKF